MSAEDRRRRRDAFYPYPTEAQALYIAQLVQDPQALRQVMPILDEDYFDDEVRDAAQHLTTVFTGSDEPPGLDEIKTHTGVTIKPYTGSIKTKRLVAQVEQFCRYRAMEYAVLNSVDLLQSSRHEEILESFTKAYNLRLSDTKPEEFVTLDDLFNQPETPWIVPGLIADQSVSIIYGQSRSFKSFLALDLAHCIQSGSPWHTIQPCEQRDVLYVCAEGQSGMRKRGKGLISVRGRPERPMRFEMNLVRIDQHFAVTQWIAKVQRLEIRYGVKFGVVMIDTISKCSPGVNQNEQENVSKIIDALYRIARELECAVIGFHHTNKQGEEFNGSYQFKSGIDTLIRIHRDGDAMTGQIKVEKQKDGTEPKFTFAVTEIDIEDDQGVDHTLVVHQVADQINDKVIPAQRVSNEVDASLADRMKATRRKQEQHLALRRITNAMVPATRIPFAQVHLASLLPDEKRNSFNRARCREWLPADETLVCGQCSVRRYVEDDIELVDITEHLPV